MRKFLTVLAILVLLLAIGQSFNLIPRIELEKFLGRPQSKKLAPPSEKQTIVYEESVITQVVEDSLPGVVTIGINKITQSRDTIQINPRNPREPFKKIPGSTKEVEQNIGSGFVVSAEGLIITNKHVVANEQATYKVLTNDKKSYNVDKIYRDPLNDLAILKINNGDLKILPLGDPSTLKLGQLVVAIGTPLGEFTNTVTSGIISGLGRGITAGSPFEGYVEKLDNVIQTDAAISSGNSGGPLLNSSGQVIGINTAIASAGQNIGFAIPVNVVKELIQNFQARGSSFERPYIGVRYKMIDKKTAILNKIVEGAYIIEVVEDSPAARSGLQQEDIIIEIDGKSVKGDDDQSLTREIVKKKIRDKVRLKIWRSDQTINITLPLEAFK